MDFFDPFALSHSSLLSKPGGSLLVTAPAVHSGDDAEDATTPPDAWESADAATTLPIKGQGTIAVKATAEGSLLFDISTKDAHDPHLYLLITTNSYNLFYGNINDPNIPKTEISAHVLKNKEACYLEKDIETNYWLSIDKGNGVLSYGKYYTNKQLTLLEAVVKEKKGKSMVFIDPRLEWIDSLKTVDIKLDDGKTDPQTGILALPVVISLSPRVAPDSQISLLDLEMGTYTTPVNLPEACQVLYGNVAGANIKLDTADFPEFSAAIERSVNTPGLLGHNMLTAKAHGTSHEAFLGTYLRITLGYNLGDSPGIPYVLEIWPKDHYSPIHDHGDANAVIKVLHGTIQATFFDSLTSPGGPHPLGAPVELTKNDITWIGPENYQVHQLHNVRRIGEEDRDVSENGEVCCTIQCYRYAKQDNVHFDGFRYVEGGEGKVFEPTSDMAFSEFYRSIKEEWKMRPR